MIFTIYPCNSIDEINDELRISLDDRLLLEFKDLRGIDYSPAGLTFGPFHKFRFTWHSNGRRVTNEYSYGEVKIISAPG